MSPQQEMALIVILSAMLAAATSAAAAFWVRSRLLPQADLGRLAEEMAALRIALEAIATRFEPIAIAAEAEKTGLASQPHATATEPSPPAKAAARTAHPVGPPPVRRFDRAEPTAVAGPTLIAVPDMAASQSSLSMDLAQATDELNRRYGPIWELADAGASADAIARGTGQPIGQVELILGLRRRLAASTAGGRP